MKFLDKFMCAMVGLVIILAIITVGRYNSLEIHTYNGPPPIYFSPSPRLVPVFVIASTGYPELKLQPDWRY